MSDEKTKKRIDVGAVVTGLSATFMSVTVLPQPEVQEALTDGLSFLNETGKTAVGVAQIALTAGLGLLVAKMGVDSISERDNNTPAP